MKFPARQMSAEEVDMNSSNKSIKGSGAVDNNSMLPGDRIAQAFDEKENAELDYLKLLGSEQRSKIEDILRLTSTTYCPLGCGSTKCARAALVSAVAGRWVIGGLVIGGLNQSFGSWALDEPDVRDLPGEFLASHHFKAIPAANSLSHDRYFGYIF